MSWSRRALFGAALAIVAAGAIASWKLELRANPADNGPLTATVTRRTLSSSVLATGAVKPQVGAEVRVGARISGKVERLHANIGDVVKKGQVIAELEKAELEARVNQRSAELRMAEAKLSAITSLRPREIQKAAADVTQWRATVDLSLRDLRRQKELLRQDFTSQQAHDRASEQSAVSQARLVSARKSLELAGAGYEEELKLASAEVDRSKASLAEAKVQLSYATITAPIAGVIGSVSTQEGETVAAGLNSPTFVTILDLERLQVDTFVDEVDIGKISPGQKALFTVDSFPAREFPGKVVAIYPKAVIQENVVNYDVVVELATPSDGSLRPEMTASVTILLDAREKVLTVPVKAVKREKGKSVVHVLADGQPRPCEVKVGWKDSQWIELLSGVEEGQAVLLEVPPEEQQ
ncbi:MAG: efflux RND transporter periplasmic adaptor subunit [Candidatus Riflebacteria bacterium]|nr:efflux RND transporter periplasmic adaptor subunit [Candidatus Riflebacteria bacterium]